MYGLNYLVYTFIIIGILLVTFVVLALLRQRKFLFKMAIISGIGFLMLQIYFWNGEVNSFVKSYVFPSKEYYCESFGLESVNLTLDLPDRTVFRGKEDGCSPFYRLYVNEAEFFQFFQEELEELQDIGTIVAYEPIKYEFINQHPSPEYLWTGYDGELSSGSRLHVLFRAVDGDQTMLIKYLPSGNTGG